MENKDHLFLSHLNQKPILYYPIYSLISGSTTSGILLTKLMNIFALKDEFFKTDEELRSEIYLTRAEFISAKNRVKNVGFIEISKKGSPPKSFYEIDWIKYKNTLFEAIKKLYHQPIEERIMNPKNSNLRNPTIATYGIQQLEKNVGIIINNNNTTSENEDSEDFKKVAKNIYYKKNKKIKNIKKTKKQKKQSQIFKTENIQNQQILFDYILMRYDKLSKQKIVPKIIKLSKLRIQHIETKIKEEPKRRIWKQMFDMIETKSFIYSKQSWFNFDYLFVRKDTIYKILEEQHDWMKKEIKQTEIRIIDWIDPNQKILFDSLNSLTCNTIKPYSKEEESLLNLCDFFYEITQLPNKNKAFIFEGKYYYCQDENLNGGKWYSHYPKYLISRFPSTKNYKPTVNQIKIFSEIFNNFWKTYTKEIYTNDLPSQQFRKQLYKDLNTQTIKTYQNDCPYMFR